MKLYEKALQEINTRLFINKNADNEQVKRVAERLFFVQLMCNLDELSEDFKIDPEGTLEKYHINLTPQEAIILLSHNMLNEYLPSHVYPKTVWEYIAFFGEKLQHRDLLRNQLGVPSNARFARWRNRQIQRSLHEIGPSSIGMIHTVLMFELSDGCSVGCPFCALSSGRLKGLYRATDDNLKLWHDVLEISKKYLGEAAGTGTCYCASEPFDNPDYEILSDEYARVLGHYPQITTAVAYRNVDRLKKILDKNLKSNNPTIHRFSALTLEHYQTILNSFTKEELLYVEILARFPENSKSRLVLSGKARNNPDIKDGINASISCASGFIVNMVRKDIRLTTPCMPSDKWPNGEIILDTQTFTDATDFEKVLLDMINRNMPEFMDMTKIYQVYRNFDIEISTTGYVINYPNEAGKLFINIQLMDSEILAKVLAKFKEERINPRQIALELLEESNVEPTETLKVAKALYENSVIY